MKKTIVLWWVLAITLSCKKNNPAPDQALLEHYPQSWIFTIDASAERYTYIYTNLNNMFRDDVDKSYSLVSLADDEHCKFYLALARAENGDQCITIQLDSDKHRWCFAAPSTNLEEKHMGMTYRDSELTAPDDDGFKFRVHHLDKVNGVKTIALESIAHPGFYISSSGPGFNYAQNQLTLQEAPGPEHATGWQCR